MSLTKAPFYEDVACGPAGGAAYWVLTEDGVKIRVGVWPASPDVDAKGTVLLFPGRTEYVEKYGLTAVDFAADGFAMVSIDWRGQGLGDRLLSNRGVGHVHAFPDYQKDVRAVVDALDHLDLSGPFYLLGHSMGGCIGLRALMENLPVKAAAFTGPMWGIALTPFRRKAGWVLSSLSRTFGFANVMSPGTTSETYVVDNPFDDNMLTTDPEMFAYMQSQVQTYPDLALGGPSLGWLNEALIECDRLAIRPTPNVPALTLLGTQERIVDMEAVRDRMSRWTNGTLQMVEGAEHEILMENPQIRHTSMQALTRFYSEHA
ncbi:alpha/beta hydrolase [Litoreibacter roseus]|uniref:Hydrolase n=1 Tax=Litoreibacter roseus TaxID=2601869 RepID=A0A6N6JJX4_9RHOB|nr:alpha/beta hydrolase [Litoreibacter roseus]GFE65739.1 hydrolase [Litoreibacter roseus]